MSDYDTEAVELRLFMEDLCCEVCRFQHLEEEIDPERIRIRQDVDLGIPDCFADIQITVPGQPTYFVEMKVGRDADEVIDRVGRKYGKLTSVSEKADKVIVVVSSLDGNDGNDGGDGNIETFEARLRERVHPNLKIEVWGPALLREKLRHHFQVEVVRFEREELVKLRAAVEHTKGSLAFGTEYRGSPAEAMLMWHLGCWTIHAVRKAAKHNCGADVLLQTGLFPDVAILVVDLCGYSAYVRDTPDDSVVQTVMTSFYTKARRAVINCGGMLSQFVGDAVIAAFGVPFNSPGYVDQAIDCAVAIMDIGKSVSNRWQRHIDRVQPVKGCHTGLALGDMLVVPHRPYSRSHMGIVSDSVDMAARLCSFAGPGQIVASNALYQRINRAHRGHFLEMQPIDAKNVGRLQSWKWDVEGARAAGVEAVAAP
jgi:class 3 adenylate cyclase